MKYICPKCNRRMPLHLFYQTKATFHGRNYQCKTCIARANTDRQHVQQTAKQLPNAFGMAVAFEQRYATLNQWAAGYLAHVFRVPQQAVPGMLAQGRAQISAMIEQAVRQAVREAA